MERADTVAERSAAARFRAHVVNPVLSVLLRSPAHRLLSGSVLLLEYSGRRTGRRYGLPVMYASSGDGFVVMAGQPADKTWWRNFGRDPQPVAVTVDGKRTLCRARLLDASSDEHRQAVEAYQRRFPKMVLDPTAPVLLLTAPREPAPPDPTNGRRP
jgi:deazaflavin-dependent oxidoreductase (nitroreductase family)